MASIWHLKPLALTLALAVSANVQAQGRDSPPTDSRNNVIPSNQFISFLVRDFLRSGDLEAIARARGIPAGKSMRDVFGYGKVTINYSGSGSMILQFNDCVGTDGLLQRIEESGFGRGTITVPDISKNQPRRILFSALNTSRNRMILAEVTTSHEYLCATQLTLQ